MINRHIINPNINYDGYSRSDIDSLINRWKSLLYSKGARKGDVVALAIMTVNVNHVAAVFACAELGLKLFLFSRPLSRETLHATKMGIFGPMDFTIVEEFMWEEDYNREMFERYGGTIIWQNEVKEYSDDEFIWVDVEPSDTFLFASTSGSTGKSKPVYISHYEMLETVQRTIDVFDFKKDSVVAHTLNMHHASALVSHLLPSLMICDTHYHCFVQQRSIEGSNTVTPEEFVDMIVDKGITHTIIAYAPVIDLYVKLLKQHDTGAMRPLKVNVSGFTMPKKFYDYTRQVPIEFYSHYGAVDVTFGSPLLLNKVDANSEYEPKLLGIQPDNFFEVNFDDLGVFVTSKLWEGIKRMSDSLDFVGGMYYHNGRNDWSEEYMKWNDEIGALIKEQHGDYTLLAREKASYLVLWDAERHYEFNMNTSPIKKMVDHIVYLKKEYFQVDTKVDMAQLGAYLEHHYEKV